MTFTENAFRIWVETAANTPTAPPLLRKLRAFGVLPAGWSHGEGVAVTADAIRIGENFVNIATQLQLQADVFPGLNGGCAVTFYLDDKSVEVVIDPEGSETFGLHVEAGKGFDFRTILQKDDASYQDVIAQAVKLLTEAWKSYASSPSINSTQSDYAFQTSSSSTRPAWVLTHLMAN